jgi:hypothetical protein
VRRGIGGAFNCRSVEDSKFLRLGIGVLGIGVYSLRKVTVLNSIL